MMEDDLDRIATWASVQGAAIGLSAVMSGRWRAVHPEMRAEYEVVCDTASLGRWMIWRSYTEFAELHQELQAFGCPLPYMPRKHYFHGSASPSVVQERLQLLPSILQAVFQFYNQEGSRSNQGSNWPLPLLKFLEIANRSWLQKPTTEEWACHLAERTKRAYSANFMPPGGGRGEPGTWDPHNSTAMPSRHLPSEMDRRRTAPSRSAPNSPRAHKAASPSPTSDGLTFSPPTDALLEQRGDLIQANSTRADNSTRAVSSLPPTLTQDLHDVKEEMEGRGTPRASARSRTSSRATPRSSTDRSPRTSSSTPRKSPAEPVGPFSPGPSESLRADACGSSQSILTPSEEAIVKAVHENRDRVLEAAAKAKSGTEWKSSGKVKGAECLTHCQTGVGGVVGVMGRGRIMASRDDVLSILTDPNNKVIERQKMEVVAAIPMVGEVEDIRVCWVSLQVPLITNRDFCVATWASAVPGTGSNPDNQEWIAGSVSVYHPIVEAHHPPSKKHVRGELLTSGWHIKPIPGETLSCGVTFMSMTKMNGKIPSALLKMGAKEGGGFINSLKKIVEGKANKRRQTMM